MVQNTWSMGMYLRNGNPTVIRRGSHQNIDDKMVYQKKGALSVDSTFQGTLTENRNCLH